MTFKETMESWFPRGFENYEGNLSDEDLLGMWNAAIEAASKELEFIDFNESCFYPHQIVDSLKAK